MAKLYDIFDVKEEIETMVRDLKQVFEELIVNSVWIDDNTKEAKMKTFESIKTLIGSPEVVLNTSWIIDHYKNIEIISREFISTLLIIKARESTEILSLIHRPNRSETDYVRWFMDPMDVNAYYSFSINSIAVPFGILQYPFYLKSINALNYGAIGSILGHEFTHAFHDEGELPTYKKPVFSLIFMKMVYNTKCFQSKLC
ncbi:neprilysin-1-like [Planococcus citri]|uniref:neprilysin-1-like n=1 Tax=Planococcus citri TaxID=170843 RepID=UPI0031FA390B